MFSQSSLSKVIYKIIAVAVGILLAAGVSFWVYKILNKEVKAPQQENPVGQSKEALIEEFNKTIKPSTLTIEERMKLIEDFNKTIKK